MTGTLNPDGAKAETRQNATVYNPDLMLGGVLTGSEIADLFRPRIQSSLF